MPLFPSAVAAGAVVIISSGSAIVHPASAQASGTMQATVTVLAAARTIHLGASRPGLRTDQVEIRPADQPEYARIEVRALDHTRPDAPPAGGAAPSAVRVTVTYLR